MKECSSFSAMSIGKNCGYPNSPLPFLPREIRAPSSTTLGSRIQLSPDDVFPHNQAESQSPACCAASVPAHRAVLTPEAALAERPWSAAAPSAPPCSRDPYPATPTTKLWNGVLQGDVQSRLLGYRIRVFLLLPRPELPEPHPHLDPDVPAVGYDIDLTRALDIE